MGLDQIGMDAMGCRLVLYSVHPPYVLDFVNDILYPS